MDDESTRLAKERTTLAQGRTDLAQERTDFAVERTLLAHERTLMAWVRTATSLISFGFTIYKFFDALNESGTAKVTSGFFGPREFAMMMIGVGLVFLVLAILEHRQSVKALAAQTTNPRRSLAQIMAGFVAALGCAGFLFVLLRQ